MKQLLTYWSINLSSVILFSGIALFIIVSKSYAKKKFLFSTLLLLAICLFSPLQILSSHYLFSSHMMVHVILLLCVGPLLALSLPAESKQFQPLFEFFKRYPFASWLTGIGIMWFWHIPIVFNSVMSSMHRSITSVIEPFSLIIAGILFSAPVIHPNKEYRIDPLSGVVYLFTACIGCSLLGLLITFAPLGTYQHFLSMHDSYRLNQTILQDWKITQSIDQQAAGLIMWVPCCLIYVTGAMYLLVHWFKQKEQTINYSKQL